MKKLISKGNNGVKNILIIMNLNVNFHRQHYISYGAHGD